ncbi:MAG: ribosomal protein bacterial type [Planctomycetota bacterium]|nr:ribosomal protein bacterial type [Planctomycetota bacterium]
MNCFQAKAGQLAPQWYVIDATDMVVGRLAAQIAPILMGKHRPTYTPHIDTGDYVIVTNVDKVVFTGNKWTQKFYQRYSGHPGGQKDEQAWKLFQRRPARVLELAIQRMMPKNIIGRHMMGKLKLVVGAKHDHQAQNPVPLEAMVGRPSATGILVAAPKVVNPPKKKVKASKPATAAVPAVHEVEAEHQLPAPGTVSEPQLPAPATTEAAEPTPEQV